MKNIFFHNTKQVLIGMVFSQSIPLLGSLLIARIYSPEGFGEFSTWLGLITTVAVLITGRLEMALVIEPDGDPRKFAIVATLATIFCMSLVVFVVGLVLYMLAPATFYWSPMLVALILPSTVLMAVSQTWQSLAAAEGLYRELTVIRITQAFGVTCVQVLVGNVMPSATGLAIGHVIGWGIGVVVAQYMIPISVGSFFPSLHEFRVRLKDFWVRHRKFPMFALPADFINTAAGQLPLFFVATKFGAEASGLYALAVRILGGPISLLGTAVLDVFKRSAATSYRNYGNCSEDYLRTFKVLALLGGALGVCVFLFAEPIFYFAFGEAWRQSGLIAIWLMPMFALRFVASPLSYVFYIVGGQRVDLIWQCGLLGMTVMVFMTELNFESSLKFYATAYACMYLIYLFLSYRYSKGGRT